MRPALGRLLALMVVLAAGAVGCEQGPRHERPSVLLVVFDTTRVDAVSAYGRVAGTTPTTDALAARGLRYTRAYAQAPWTLPSHATLFTGLLPSEHGVGWRHTRAADELVTLAERLRDSGYETVGISENPWISPAFNMAQGFEHFVTVKNDRPDLGAVVARWARTHHRGRPFFLFVNILDAHAPYSVREENPFLPAGVSAAAARAVPQRPEFYFCSTAPHVRELAVLGGLYLGDVKAADDKLARVLRSLRQAGMAEHIVTIVTADHGEHLGEHRLVGHQFSVREALLHVPLIVHGLRGVTPAVIDSPVEIADVTPSVLQWVGIRIPRGLEGRPLPTMRLADAPPRVLVAEHDDLDDEHAPDASPIAAYVRVLGRTVRRGCGREDRVYGGMRAAILYPWKLIWYAKYPPELYNLSADPGEGHDLASSHGDMVATLTAALRRHVRTAVARGRVPAGGRRQAKPPPELIEQLRALGYVARGGEERPTPAPHGRQR